MEEMRETAWKELLFSGLRMIPFRSRRFLLGVVAIAVAAYLLSGIYAVGPQQLGVVVRFGKVVADAVAPGIHYHLPYPIETVYKPKTAEIKKLFLGVRRKGSTGTSQSKGLEMLTGDTNVLLVQAVIQYAISDPVKYLFATEDPQTVIEAAADQALTRIVGSMSVDSLLTTEKLHAQTLVKQKMQEVLDSYNVGVKAIGAYCQEIGPPVEVAYAFRDVASAREDKNRLISEAEGYRNQVIPTTRGQADKMIKDAEGYSKERIERARGEAERFLALLEEYRKSKDLTASRIYVEKMEKILPRLKIYVVDRGKEGGVSNLRLLLPKTSKR